MAKKENDGPSISLIGLIITASISVVMGFLFGFVNLAITPVENVRELPKEEDLQEHTVYFIQGEERGGGSYKGKERAFLNSTTGKYKVSEAELNTWARNTFNFKKLTAPKGPNAADESVPMFLPSTPNFRLSDSVMQVAMSLELNALGINKKLWYHAKGNFEKYGVRWRFVVDRSYVGSAPIPTFLDGIILDFLLGLVESNSENYVEIENAWAGIDIVNVDGADLLMAIKGN